MPGKLIRLASAAVVIGLLLLAGATANAAAPATVEKRFPGLASGVLRSARLVAMPAGILLKIDGIEIKAADIERMLQQAAAELRPQLEKNRFYILEQEASQRIIVREARALPGTPADLPDDQAVKRLFDQLTAKASVSEAEARAFYDANKEMVGGTPYEQVAEAIKQLLLQNKQADAVQEYLAALEKRLSIQVNEQWVKAQYAPARDNPVDRARGSGKPTLIEFGAAGCVPCDMMQPILDKLRKEFPTRLNVVFVHVEEEKVLAARFGIRAIPVQVFYDRDGKEVFRHEGFLAEPEVRKVLTHIGVN
ncbi:MAG: thioredoxin domain-containing protein [Desulfobacterales bacterium]|jgi:thiol-disulfide isomerase/thioredoxin|nr:thioredoxin domain-containing protein [Desulfobacterales bacterium]